jgi:hypothetical protein
MRGIPVIQIPTTLLAQVDAAIGGKTGVDLREGKNLIGTFHQPSAVLIDPDVLATLPEREYIAGLFEVLKHGVIRSPELFRMMAEQPEAVLRRDPHAVDTMVAESVRIKSEVVSADEREGDLRRILNFGHTIGRAESSRIRPFCTAKPSPLACAGRRTWARLTGASTLRPATRSWTPWPSRPLPPHSGIRAENLAANCAETRDRPRQGALRAAGTDRQGAHCFRPGENGDRGHSSRAHERTLRQNRERGAARWVAACSAARPPYDL